MKFSVVIPFYNEEENVEIVLNEVKETCPGAEIIAVDDGSSDTTAEKIDAIEGVTLIKLPENRGQSAALYRGLYSATTDICVMMDGDGQNDPADIPTLVEKLEAGEGDLICGYRANRQDSWSKKVASRIANNIRRSVLKDGIRDTGCTLKAMRREDVRFLIPFNGLHRFIPALCVNAGMKIVEVPVNHRARQYGLSKYTVGGRAVRGIWDMVGVSWFLSRQIKWTKCPYTS